jgi:hypothetical protein
VLAVQHLECFERTQELFQGIATQLEKDLAGIEL